MSSLTTPFLLIERFWEKVNKTENCWNWTGATRCSVGQKRNRGNYGVMIVNGRAYSSHRVSWEIHNGPIRNSLHVLHHCDNCLCVKPDHLWLGTNLDNIADKTKKGRTSKICGEQISWSILTEEKVRKIRSWHSSGKYKIFEIAKMLGIKQATIGAVVRRLNWKHIYP